MIILDIYKITEVIIFIIILVRQLDYSDIYISYHIYKINLIFKDNFYRNHRSDHIYK